MLRVVTLAAILLVAVTAAAGAPTPRVRLAAATDCTHNRNCAPGLRRVYGIDPTGSLVRLKVADAGIQALDDGLAEVAVAFSSNPQLSRPDILSLRGDRHMISSDHVVPVVRASLLERYGSALRRRLDAASRLLTTVQLRGLNQEIIGGRLPEAVGGGFVDANALGGEPAHRRSGPRIVVGYQAFAENQTLAYMYAARRCAAPGSGRPCARSAGCGRRRSPSCAAGASGCGPATRARCSATSAGPR